MEHRLERYFFGALGFAFVVAWATLGATVAIFAAALCLVALNAQRLSSLLETSRRRASSRPRTRSISVRPLQDEDAPAQQLVPDDPSLVISAS